MHDTRRRGLAQMPYAPTREDVLRAMVLIDHDRYEFNKEPWADEDIALKVTELHDLSSRPIAQMIDMGALRRLLDTMTASRMLVAHTREEWAARGKNPTNRGGQLLYATHAHLGLWGLHEA